MKKSIFLIFLFTSLCFSTMAFSQTCEESTCVRAKIWSTSPQEILDPSCEFDHVFINDADDCTQPSNTSTECVSGTFYHTRIEKWFMLNDGTWQYSGLYTYAYTTHDYGSEPIFETGVCPSDCTEESLTADAALACFGENHIASIDLELCEFQCSSVTCSQLDFDFQKTLVSGEVYECQCTTDTDGKVLSNECSKKDCNLEFSNCETYCNSQGLQVSAFDCDFSTTKCTCEEDTCALRYKKCLKYCGQINNFSCDPSQPSLYVCDCYGNNPDNNDTSPPSDVDDNSSDNGQSSDVNDTIEESNNKLVDNTDNLIDNQIAANDLQKQIGDQTIDILNRIEDNTNRSAKSLNDLESGAHITDLSPFDKMEQQFDLTLQENINDQISASENAQSTASEVSSWYSSFMDTVFDFLLPSGQCEDIIIDVPGRSEQMVISCDIFDKIRIILKWLVYISTTFCLLGMLLSIGPDGKDNKQTAFLSS